jgi:hypothetical protein
MKLDREPDVARPQDQRPRFYSCSHSKDGKHVEHQAAEDIRVSVLQKLPRRREGRDLQPHRPEEPLQRFAHRGIIIHDEYHSVCFAHDILPPLHEGCAGALCM